LEQKLEPKDLEGYNHFSLALAHIHLTKVVHCTREELSCSYEEDSNTLVEDFERIAEACWKNHTPHILDEGEHMLQG